ncbi:hypothetical protein C0J52_11352 [Blattella germanica]|nr:hypothetical protein C0J52_11352 [Blattella germanica]
MWIEDLRLQLLLPTTEAYKQHVKEHRMKKSEIWEEFYRTDAMTKEDWKGPNYDLRHFVTRYAAYRFHHLVRIQREETPRTKRQMRVRVMWDTVHEVRGSV